MKTTQVRRVALYLFLQFSTAAAQFFEFSINHDSLPSPIPSSTLPTPQAEAVANVHESESILELSGASVPTARVAIEAVVRCAVVETWPQNFKARDVRRWYEAVELAIDTAQDGEIGHVVGGEVADDLDECLIGEVDGGSWLGWRVGEVVP